MDVSRHDEIVDAIGSGDPHRAIRAVPDHMTWASTNLVRDR